MEVFFHNLLEQLSYNAAEPLIFNTGFFLFFFLFVLIFNQFFVNNKRAQIIFLLTESLYFYYKSSGVFFVLVIISSLIDYIAGKSIAASDSKGRRKFYLVISLITNLGILGYFKYTNFFLDTINSIGAGHFDMMDIFLPVGVSFFTFQSMSYTIDVYRNKLKPVHNFFDFVFFVSFFPQLVAGPIVRAADFLPQIHKPTFVTKADLGKAFFLIIAGLLKKAVIADFISINFVDRVFQWPTRFTGVENLLGIYGYVLQIYCDFSGYSDMAIGIALLLGFRLPDNFNAPYKSKTITEIWQRWHISLSSWLRDYLYIPLGGNRKGKVRTYINLMLTMLLGGLWHGAAWRFMFWGGIHGLALAIERFFHIPKRIEKSKLLKIIGVVVTFHIWTISLIFFRSQSYAAAFDMINQILNYFNGAVFFQFVKASPVVFALMIIGYVSHYLPLKWELKMKDWLAAMPNWGRAFVIVIVIYIVAQFKSANIQPFIYFQF